MINTTKLPRVAPAILISRFIRSDLDSLLRKAARGVGISVPTNYSVADLRIPDSALAVQATRLVAELSSPVLFNHTIRTYLFGEAMGRRGRLKYDRELFYLASVLHDLGLTPTHNGSDSFELEGARAAHAFLRARGLPDEKADLVHEAIALHSSVGIASKKVSEIALVHFGAGMDVFGYRAMDLAPKTIEHIVEAYPRLEFKDALVNILEDEVRRKPQSHIAGLVGLGFCKKIKCGPFCE